MPITVCFTCIAFIAILLLIPIVPISLILLDRSKKRAALTLLGIPLALLGLSVLSTIAVFVILWQYGVRMSQNPDRLFERTFSFWPPAEIEVLEAYCEPGLDGERRVLKFRAPPAVIKEICGKRFTPTNREVFLSSCPDRLPDRVASWFLPAVEQADRFYIAEPFDDSYTVHNKAILCYSEKTGIACFHWSGVD